MKMLKRKNEIADSSGIPRAFGPARRLCALLLSLVLVFGLLPTSALAYNTPANGMTLSYKSDDPVGTGAAFKKEIEESGTTFITCTYVENISVKEPIVIKKGRDVVLSIMGAFYDLRSDTKKWYSSVAGLESLFRVEAGGSLTINCVHDNGFCWIDGDGTNKTRFAVVENGGTLRISKGVGLKNFGASGGKGGAILVKNGGKAYISDNSYDPMDALTVHSGYDAWDPAAKGMLDATAFSGCTADMGGAIYVEAGGYVEMKGGHFESCTARLGREIYLAEPQDKSFTALKMSGIYCLRLKDGDMAKEDIYVEDCADRQIVYGNDFNLNVALHRDAEKKLTVTSVYKGTDTAFKPFRVETNYVRTESGEVMNDTYILRVGTNQKSGDNVLCFGVHYKDDQGIMRTQYIYPQEGDANEVYRVAGKMDLINSRVALLKKMTGYTIEGCENGFTLDSNEKMLTKNSTSYFLFKPIFPFQKLVGIDVCMFYDRVKGKAQGWSCSDLSFFRVKQFYDINMEGYLSKKPHLSFSGELLAQKKTGVTDFSMGKSDVIYRFSEKDGENGKMQFFSTPQPYDEKSTAYLFEIDIADVYGAGIEALAADYGTGERLTDVVEELMLTVDYEDLRGGSKQVTIPVITSSLVWAVEEGLLAQSMPIVGVAQQGERLFFKGVLPDLKQFKDFYITYGSDENGNDVAKAAGLSLPNPTQRQTSRLNEQKVKSDKFNLAGIRVYPGNVKVARDDSSPASLLLQVEDPNEEPIYQYMSKELYGDVFGNGKRKVDLSEVVGKESANLDIDVGSDLYIASVTTDNFDLAATSNDVEVSLQYRSIDGRLLRTQDYSLKEGALEYYGYWPGNDAAYRYAMGPGRTLEFLVIADNVDTFVGATLTIKSGGTGTKIDDWQMSALSIREYAEPGERKAQWTDALSYTDRIFERDKTESTLYAKYPNAIDVKEAEEDGVLPVVYLCADTPSVSITFNNEGRSVVAEEEERDWEALRYSMTIADAHQNLKFIETMCEYTVNVEVANNSTENLGNGDAGSNDLFYFMLDFKNGSSAYVLANQLLEADGFRAGMTESFSIRTNRDYGPLVSVHIIPEHSTDDNMFDKLNIKEITVSKTSNESVSRMWVIKNVGWIGSDYVDKGAESSIKGRPGRSENELAQVFNVTQEGYAVNILFTMKTGSYGANEQLTGAMFAAVEYYDINGEWHKDTVDIVKKMYEYAGINGEECEVRDGSDKSYKGNLDPSFMMRANKTDRFILAIPNLRQITRVTFKVRGAHPTIWKMEELAIYTIESTGLLQINVDGEYQRSNKVTLLAKGKNGGEALIPAPDHNLSSHGAEQEISISMGDHRIEVNMDDSAWSSTITREPQSNDDSLNVYIYTETAIPDDEVGKYTMSATVTCDLAETDGTYQAGQTGMTPVADGTMFCALSIPARGISGVTELILEASAERNPVVLDHAVVQHVRSGVTINTYTFDLNNSTAARRQKFTPSASSAVTSQQEKQVVKLLFAEDTEEQVLEKEINDIVVAIRYSSTNDAQRTGQQANGGGVLYNSKYIYLSDLNREGTENQKYTKIKPGMIAEIEFNEAYVGDIVGISLASVGSLRAHIQSAYIQSESTVNGKTETQWYNFADEIYVDNVPQMLNKSARETVTPVKMTFETKDDLVDMGKSGEVGAEIPIRMTVYYCNGLTNVLDSVTFENLKIYVTDGGFKRGETATVEFFLKNLDIRNGIRYITLEPLSAYSVGAAWGLETVACTTLIGGEENNYIKAVNKMILQGDPVRVNLGTVNVKIKTKVYSDVAEDYIISGNTNSGNDDPVLTVRLKPKGELRILPEVLWTLDGYGYTVHAVRGESVSGGIEVTCYHITSDGTQVVFTPPEMQTDVTYAIRIASEELPDSYCDVIVTVEGAPKVEGNEDRAPVNSSDTKEEKTDDGENADEGGSGEGGTPPETPPEA